MKKCIALFLVAVLSLSLLAGCGKKNNDINIASGGYLAQGTIPADAKIHPILDENLTMNTIKNGAEISEEDVFEIVNIVDKFETITCTNEENPDGSFLMDMTVESIRGHGSDVISEFYGSQILDLTFQNAEKGYALVLAKVNGKITNNPDGKDYEGDVVILWEAGVQKIDGKWFIYYTGDHFVNYADDFIFERDTVNGTINVIQKTS